MLQKRPILFIVLAFILGWAIGLFLFGWGLTPLEYVGAGPEHLNSTDQELYLRSLAALYSHELDPNRVTRALAAWPDADVAICQLAAQSTDPGEQQRLIAIASIHNNGVGCPAGGQPQVPGETEEEGGGLGNILLICGLGLILAILAIAIFLVTQRRGKTSGYYDTAHTEMPTTAPVMEGGDTDQQVTPIARFQTNYVRGHDTYDDSFSIENANGDFLGECGVGVSETIGAETPKNVTAFEVWLFDKNDIRTVTKVIMSEHAFFDDAIKAKLAPKGEPVLARPNETVVLETASLIINAEITELEYGTGTLPPQSFFERFTVELSAWAKEGEYGEPDVQGRIDEMLEF
ncbi:MAG: hypothetical protein L0332_15125 [Chloroflexi bacterium]|nr:hypothetical protein [Chloroflexota bacterium]MCI0577744.1 hypothetical protein [Chloroflexota bacterium]MCI0644650.1 hypothetical protein [Chloroflexota bacterium]MCI0728034.1 hypothetical protein [Chloroflexota bacterium]